MLNAIYIYIFADLFKRTFLGATALYGLGVSVSETNTPVFGGAAVLVFLEISCDSAC